MTVNKIQTDPELGFDVPALPGMAVSNIQTPCLIIDMDSFDYNLKRMADLLTPYNVSLRAHAKMHKSIEVARRQLAQGKTTGICCQKSQKQKFLLEQVSAISSSLIKSAIR